MKFRDTKPLPSEITDERVNNATLPVKIETARRAIAECRDLPELLRYRDQAEGLAAAVRTMKQVGPEMIRAANCLMADAWRKGGELLSAYSGVSKGGRTPNVMSLRHQIARDVGLSAQDTSHMVRVHKAPVESIYAAAQNSRRLSKVAARLPRLGRAPPNTYSDSARAILKGSFGSNGLTQAAGIIRNIDIANFKLLTPEECKVVKAKITEIVELLDEMDRLCR